MNDTNAPPEPPMRADLAKLRALHEAATRGEWMLATSCSWRRILTTDGRPVMVPTIQRSDNHPDMDCGIEYVNAELAIAAVNALPDLIAEIERLRAIAEAVERDAKRLDALEAMGYSYGFEDMHEGHCWKIEGPYPNVRAALDAALDRLLAIGEDG